MPTHLEKKLGCDASDGPPEGEFGSDGFSRVVVELNWESAISQESLAGLWQLSCRRRAEFLIMIKLHLYPPTLNSSLVVRRLHHFIDIACEVPPALLANK